MGGMALKRHLFFIAITLLSVILLAGYTGFATTNVIKINDVTAEIPEGMGQIRERDDRTFVPLRFVSEFLQNEVWYMENSKYATVSSDQAVILVQDGNENLFITSKLTGQSTTLKMDTSAYIDEVEGRMYLPIRFLAEAIGYDVGWDEATETVTLDISK